jgi:hypothetical protein
MLAFQIIVVAFCLYAVFRVWQKIKTRAMGKRWGVLWLVFWLTVGTVVALPWTTSLLAARLGVTRGVDLVVYVSVIVLFYLLFRLTIKIEKLEKNITALVRQVALDRMERTPDAENKL